MGVMDQDGWGLKKMKTRTIGFGQVFELFENRPGFLNGSGFNRVGRVRVGFDGLNK